HLPGDPYHRTVRLELGERGAQQFAGTVGAEGAHQVDRHVVGRPEAGTQRIGTGRGEPGDLSRVDLRVPHHDRVPLDIDATPPGTSRELRVLTWRQVDVGLTVELDQLLQHHTARWHADAQAESLGGEHR